MQIIGKQWWFDHSWWYSSYRYHGKVRNKVTKNSLRKLSSSITEFSYEFDLYVESTVFRAHAWIISSPLGWGNFAKYRINEVLRTYIRRWAETLLRQYEGYEKKNKSQKLGQKPLLLDLVRTRNLYNSSNDFLQLSEIHPIWFYCHSGRINIEFHKFNKFPAETVQLSH